MRTSLTILLLLAAGASGVAATLPSSIARGTSITVEETHRILDSLASDALKGRSTGSAELDTAASFIASEFARAGVEPLGASYFLPFELQRINLNIAGTSLGASDGRVALKDGFVPYEFTGAGSIESRVVFVGFGLSLSDSGYDDYASVDVRGRIVVAVSGQPARFGGERTSRTPLSAGAREKARQAALHGAAGFLMVGNPRQSRLLRPFGYPWPGVFPGVPKETSRLRLAVPDSVNHAIPSASISGDAARRILGFPLDRLVRILDSIDRTGAPASMLLDSRASLSIALDRSLTTVRNVVGVVRGRTRPGEYVVVGAHYDHIGTAALSIPGADAMEQDSIYNGADDNASGTTGMLLMAQAVASLPGSERPERSMLFVAFAGEELGLFGSRAFVASAPVAPDSMIAMINLDMIGRNSPDSLFVGGADRSPELQQVVREANAVPDSFKLAEDIEQYFYRSDQAAFAAAGVPVIFYNSGEHPDYHKVTDEADRIDYGKLVRVARLALRSAWILSAIPSRPSFRPIDRRDPSSSILDF